MKTRLILLAIILIIFGLIAVTYYFPPTGKSESVFLRQNIAGCLDYASLSHEKEFTPSRWQLVKEMGWTKKDWFDACMNNLNHPVAK